MDTARIYEAAVLKKGEDIVDQVDCSFRTTIENVFHKQFLTIINGALVLTNKRLLFVSKPKGWNAKGVDLHYQCSLGSVLSISTAGMFTKEMNITVQENEKTSVLQFPCKTAEIFAQKIIEQKNKFVEEKTIEAKKVIIEEGTKDTAAEMLKKRLVRGEITKEEFHEKIQRT